jgi:hypothetical protein
MRESILGNLTKEKLIVVKGLVVQKIKRGASH